MIIIIYVKCVKKETKFINLSKGYHNTCCHRCHAILQNKECSLLEQEIINNKRKSTWSKKDLVAYKNLQSEVQKIRWKNTSETRKNEIGKKISRSLNNRSIEDKQKAAKNIGIKNKKRLLNMSLEEKELYSKKVSAGLKKYYKNMSIEQRQNYSNIMKERLSHISEETKIQANKKRSETRKNKSQEEKQKISKKNT